MSAIPRTGPLNWLRNRLRDWLGVPSVAPVPMEEPKKEGMEIHPSLLNQQLVKAGERFLIHREVKPPELPPNVRGGFVYDPEKDKEAALGPPVLAMDDAVNAPAWAYLNQTNCGLGFPGYGYLSELSQLSEYRAPTEVTASEMTREFIEITTNSKATENKNEETANDRALQDDMDGDGDVDDDDLEDKVEQIKAALVKFKVRDHFRKLAELDGFYGRGQLFIDIDPGRLNPDDVNQLPLVVSPETIRKGSLRGFKVIEPIWTTPYSYNSSDPTRGDFYKPSAWFVIGKRVHASRLLTFISREVADILKPGYNFGGLSLSQLMEPYVFRWLRTRNSVSDLTHNFSVMCLKTDMTAVLAGGDATAARGLLDRAKLFTQTRDNQGLALLDMKREEMVEIHASLSGLDKLQAQSQEHMAAPSHMPLVKLTGITPAGLNADSEGEIKVWYDFVKSSQIVLFGPHVQHIINIIQLHLFGSIDEAITYTFVPLDSPSVKELAEIRKTDAEADGVYIDKGVISADEARERIAADPDSGYNNLSGNAPPAPEAGLLDKEHELGEESADNAHQRGLETIKTQAKLKPAVGKKSKA